MGDLRGEDLLDPLRDIAVTAATGGGSAEMSPPAPRCCSNACAAIWHERAFTEDQKKAIPRRRALDPSKLRGPAHIQGWAARLRHHVLHEEHDVGELRRIQR